MLVPRLRLLSALLLLAVLLLPIPARSAQVSGVLLGTDSKPAAARQLHFEGRVTGDMFLVRTDPNGSFSATLPSGAYDLRTESGAIVLSDVIVHDADLSLGDVREPSRFSLFRLFHLEGVARGLVGSQAPSTSNIPAIGERARASQSEAEAEPPPSAEASPAAAPSPAAPPKAASAPAWTPAPIE